MATIDGRYDCFVYDTPSLTFNNASDGTFINAKMVLTAYQRLNNGITQTVSLPDIDAGTSYTYNWLGPTVAGNLTAYDYDDSSDGGLNDPNCVVGLALCNRPGNFSVTFTATVSGAHILASPSSLCLARPPTRPAAFLAGKASILRGSPRLFMRSTVAVPAL